MKTKIKNLLFISLIFSVLISCNKKNINSNERISEIDTVANNEHIQDTTTENKIVTVELEKQNANNLKMLSGIWGEEGENAAWIIKDDTLQFFDDMESGNGIYYLITYNNAILTIKDLDGKSFLNYKVLKLSQDSLKIMWEDGVTMDLLRFGDSSWYMYDTHKE